MSIELPLVSNLNGVKRVFRLSLLVPDLREITKS